jgi:hypothetical protein
MYLIKSILQLNRSTYTGESWLSDTQLSRLAASRIDERTFLIEKTQSETPRPVPSVLFMLEYDEKALIELVSIKIGDNDICGCE